MRGWVASAIAISSCRCSPWLMLDTSTSPRVAEPDARERGARRLAQFGLAARIAPEVERVAGVRLHGERDIVERGEIGKQRGDLERAREPELAAPVDRQRGDVVAGEADAAGIGRDLAGELADQRGLAGAVRPDDRMQLAGRHVERDRRRRRPRRRSAWSGRRSASSASATARAREQAVDAAAREQHDQQQQRAEHDLPVFRGAHRTVADERRGWRCRSAPAAPPPAPAARPRRSAGRTSSPCRRARP